MKKIVLLLLAINSYHLYGQIILTKEGIVINNEETGTWLGDNIPRSKPTIFTYRNNSISSVNTQGYMLQAGDEKPQPSNNNLDGQVVTGNKFIWNGINSPDVITHGLFVGYNINSTVKFNYLENVPYGIIFKSGTDDGVNMTSAFGGAAYNICKNGKFAVRMKGINGVQVYNNTFYNDDGSGWYFIFITENMDRPVQSPSTGTKIFNNIFYATSQYPMIQIESGCFTGFECDYNVYWCTKGEPIFNIDGIPITWAQWRALGFDAHSIIADPNFKDTIDLVPTNRLDLGKDLGTEWETGLSNSASWIAGISPATTFQNGTWQVGARIYQGPISVSSISVNGAAGATAITENNGMLQLNAAFLPVNATNQSVTWSIVNGTGQATISATGLLTAVENGTVTARATANDGSGVFGTLIITISNQVTPVSSITVTGTGNATTITSDNGTLLLNAGVLPANATNQSVTWSMVNGTGQATISATGLVTAVENGSVTARATANDGSGVFGTLFITISNQVTPISSITVTSTGNATTIATDNGTLLLNAEVLPANATNQSVTWSMVNGTGQATISATGLVTALVNGTVTAQATANDGSEVFGTFIITISNQVTPVLSITLAGAAGATTITEDNGTLQLNAEVLPSDATNKSLTWSMVNGTGQATISGSGLVTAEENGTVTTRATANDGSEVFGTFIITISNQVTPVLSITVAGAAGATTITTDNGTLQLNAEVLPSDATNQSFTWSIVNGTGQASISATGLVTALVDGTVTAQATANDGSGVFGTLVITISNQVTLVSAISVTGAEGETTITTDSGMLQLNAEVLPSDATNQSFTWSIVNGTGQATISSSGLVTAVENGIVTAQATANDGSGVFGTLVITISNQVTLVSAISVTGAEGETTITADNGTLQLNAEVLPSDATNQSFTWSIVNGTGQATISAAGLVTALENGTVTARATANDGSEVFGTLIITISNQVTPVSSISVFGTGDLSSIIEDKGTLQLNATVFPDKASNLTVTWSIVDGTGRATIDSNGLVTAIENGTVTARATANDDSGVYGFMVIIVSNQVTNTTYVIDIETIKPITIHESRSELKIELNKDFISGKANLYTIQGVLISCKLAESNIIMFDISRLQSGMYIVVLSKGINSRAAKIIKP